MTFTEKVKQYFAQIAERQKKENQIRAVTPVVWPERKLKKFQAALNKIIDGIPDNNLSAWVIYRDDVEATAAYTYTATQEFMWLVIFRGVEYHEELKEYFEAEVQKLDLWPSFRVVFI